MYHVSETISGCFRSNVTLQNKVRMCMPFVVRAHTIFFLELRAAVVPFLASTGALGETMQCQIPKDHNKARS